MKNFTCSGSLASTLVSIVAAGAAVLPTVALADSAVMFIENVGQFPQGARFQVWGGGCTIWLAEDAIWVTVTERPALTTKGHGDKEVFSRSPQRGANLRVSFAGSNRHPRLEPFGRLETSVNYFLGNDPAKWRTHVPVWRGVRYVDLYPGVDLEVRGEAGRWSWRLVTKPGADLSAVRLRVEGAEEVEVRSLAGGEQGLGLRTGVGEYTLPLLAVEGGPVGHARVEAASAGCFEVVSPFAVGSSSADGALSRIGPADASELTYATYLGGSNPDHGYGIAVDGRGAAYVTGGTLSEDFPTTPGAYDSTFNGGDWDAFVVKLSPAGDRLVYATFLGGSGSDYGDGIAVDESGSAYVTGITDSDDFPTTPGAYDRTYNGGHDAFVVKLSPAGELLVYATFLGGSAYDAGHGGIAVDGSGSAYVTGWTTSSDFPTTPGAYDRTRSGYHTDDAFVVKLSASGDALVYATFLGGSDYDYGYGITVDGSGSAYVTGETKSDDFPGTPGAYNGTPGYDDAFVVKLSPAGDALIYATFLGGYGCRGKGIAVDESGAAYVTGHTASDDFPTTPGAYDSTFNGGYCDAFVVKLSPAGDSLTYATFLGGSGWDRGYDIAVDGKGSAFVTGETKSNDFPTAPGAYDRSHNGYRTNDAFLVKLSPGGDALVYGTFLGGGSWDGGYAIAVDASGLAYISGETASDDFPTTPGAFDRTNNGGYYDAFVVKLNTLVAGISRPSRSTPAIPERFLLSQNYPNPFNPVTTIAFSLPHVSPVRLEIYDVSGRKVRTLAAGHYSAGSHTLQWDGTDDAGRPVPSGVYWCRLQAGKGFVQSRKMVLLR